MKAEERGCVSGSGGGSHAEAAWGALHVELDPLSRGFWALANSAQVAEMFRRFRSEERAGAEEGAEAKEEGVRPRRGRRQRR